MPDIVSEQDRRKVRRNRTLKSGRIVVSEKAPKIECAVRNLSDSGAYLQVASSTFGIPDEFDLMVGGSSARRRCHVIWRTEIRLGVRFR